MAAVFALRDLPWACGVALETSPERVSTSQFGTSVSEVDLGGARELPRAAPFRTLWGGLPGRQSYSLSYSENVDRMSIWLDRDLVYSGVPISTFDASDRTRAKRVGVRVEGSGDTFFVQISDQCSLRGLSERLL